MTSPTKFLLWNQKTNMDFVDFSEGTSRHIPSKVLPFSPTDRCLCKFFYNGENDLHIFIF